MSKISRSEISGGHSAPHLWCHWLQIHTILYVACHLSLCPILLAENMQWKVNFKFGEKNITRCTRSSGTSRPTICKSFHHKTSVNYVSSGVTCTRLDIKSGVFNQYSLCGLCQNSTKTWQYQTKPNNIISLNACIIIHSHVFLSVPKHHSANFVGHATMLTTVPQIVISQVLGMLHYTLSLRH